MDFFANYLKLFDISEACWPLRFDLHVEDALDCIDCLLPAEAVPYKLLEVPVLDYLKGKLYGARGGSWIFISSSCSRCIGSLFGSIISGCKS